MSKDLFASLPTLRVEQTPESSGQGLAAFLASNILPRAAKLLHENEYFIESILVLDTTEGYLIVYHFDHFEKPGRVTLRVPAPHDAPEVPTISDIFSGASWHEREAHDFHGVVFTGLENQTPLLLPPDADFHPLRKDDKSRKSVKDILELGETVSESPAFTLFAEPEPEPEPEPKEEATS